MGWYDELRAGVRAVFALTPAERADAPHHCGAPGDPAEAYPIRTAADARDAWTLAGHSADPAAVRACVQRIAGAEGWPLPAPAQMTATYSFTATGPTEGDLVIRQGKVFEAGTWPDQAFALTAEELDAAVATFAPVPLELEHFATRQQFSIFDGKLGTLRRIWREGTNLLGEVAVPPWVDSAWGDHGRKISAVWNLASKRLERAGLCLHPLIPDAALFAAEAAFAGRRHNALDQHLLDSAHHSLVQAGATCPLPSPRPAWAGYTEETPMSETPPADLAAFAAERTALAAERAAFEAERTRLAEERALFARHQYWTQAETLVAGLLSAGHVLPAQNQPDADGKPRLVAAFAAAFADDAAGTAVFAQAGGSRVRALQAIFTAATPGTALLTDVAGGQVLTVPAPPAADAAAQAARVRSLLAQTPLGQRTLAAEGGR